MTKKEQEKYKALLSDIFVPRNDIRGNTDPDKGVAFSQSSFDVSHPLSPIREAVSNAMHDSGLTHNFSYEIANIAVDILAGDRDWNDNDELCEAIDNCVPVYNSTLMTIYLDNWNSVDEAVKDMGGESDGAVRNAQKGWYLEIQAMIDAIKHNLEL